MTDQLTVLVTAVYLVLCTYRASVLDITLPSTWKITEEFVPSLLARDALRIVIKQVPVSGPDSGPSLTGWEGLRRK